MSNEILQQDYRAALAKHTENQRANYARLREFAAVMTKRCLVRYNKERHAYEARLPSRHVSRRELAIVANFMQLQRNIDDQSRLLLELAWTIEQEEKQPDE